MTDKPQVKLLDHKGKTIDMSSGAHRGARADRDLMSWSPSLRSADADLLPDLNSLVARAHDLARNDPSSSGAIQTHLDNIIGSGLRLACKPDYRVLGVDAEVAAEWARDVEAKFRNWAYDPRCYIDAGRRNNLAGLLGLAYRQFLVSGESLAVAEWMPKSDRKYATAIQMVDPARLSNPNGTQDTARTRGGVDLDRYNAPVGYHIRTAMQSDMFYAGAKVYKWKRVAGETRWGRKKVIHIFEQERAGQTRGKTGLASILANSFKLNKFQDLNLEAAIINSMYAAVIESEFDYAQVAEALGGNADGVSPTGLATDLLGSMASYHSAETVKMDGVKIPHLYPGEKLNFTTSENPGPNYGEFEKSFHRNMAAGWNMSYEMYARNYSDANYAGMRAGLQQTWKFFINRRELIGSQKASAIFHLWLEEAMDKGVVEPMPGAPDYYDAPYAYGKCKWIGPGKDQIDNLKETRADIMEVDSFLGTLEEKNAARGEDWEEIMEQRVREVARKKQLMTKYGVTEEDLKGSTASTSNNPGGGKSEESDAA